MTPFAPDLVVAERQAQGLPPTCVDPLVYRDIAVLVNAAQHTARGASGDQPSVPASVVGRSGGAISASPSDPKTRVALPIPHPPPPGGAATAA